MQRYNQGFGTFGLMEQCKEGKWVTYEEHSSICNTLTNKLRRQTMYGQELVQRINLQNSTIFNLTNWLVCISSIAIVNTSILIYLLVKHYV